MVSTPFGDTPDRARGARHDHITRPVRVQSGHRVQNQPPAAADHGPRSFRRDEFHGQVTPEASLRGDEDFDGRDDVERVEPVE